MKAIVTVVEKLTSEAHINIPDGLSEPEIRQHIVDLQGATIASKPRQIKVWGIKTP
jgi:hypothetical protein